ncbi:MAG: PTPA-CTERM sorting domain-containing protein [Leptolyngbyaceae cyanobacterium HOT.MB2.61]|nr:PTPA-CTERM sorting domain-containing protein [Leptolyngbyaceae cyanobacterium HOT.MB2.61]
MTTSVMQKLSVAATGAACIALGIASFEVSPAQAAILTAPFTVEVPVGTGTETGTGTVTFDSDFVSAIGLDVVNPVEGLLSLNLNLLGNTFTESSSAAFPILPALFFNDGAIAGLLFDFELAPGTQALLVPFTNQVFTSAGGIGSVTFGEPTAIPTPALLPGLVGLGMSIATLRKRQAEKARQA